jgi:Glu-tRNA(Gln) amidotransferase subunit E-like FAD-binding protein
MERIRFIEHQGQRILLVDLSRCEASELPKLVDQVPQVVTAEPPSSVLLLADFTGSTATREVIERVKIAAALDRKHIKRAAWVFNGNIPKPLHDSVQMFSSRDIPKFEDREKAMAFLVSGG